MKKILLSVFALSIIMPVLAFASFDISLKYGSRGDAVMELQDFLTDQSFLTGKIDGRFGFGTLKAVKSWQSANGLISDGYFGKGSRAKANNILADLLKDSDATEQAETGNISQPIELPIPKPTTDISQDITPVIPKVIIPFKFTSGFELDNKFGSHGNNDNIFCDSCIWLKTNKPSKITLKIDDQTITSNGYSTEHFFKEYSDTKVYNRDVGYPVVDILVTDLNLDKTRDHIFYIADMIATDGDGNSIQGYGDYGKNVNGNIIIPMIKQNF
jgi:peptidoglycan hydrolase-like protein with peptidoglycan-binding domain